MTFHEQKNTAVLCGSSEKNLHALIFTVNPFTSIVCRIEYISIVPYFGPSCFHHASVAFQNEPTTYRTLMKR